MSRSPTLNALVHPNSISAGPLPKQQSFTYLKQQGIKQLKRLAGNVWSNYNDSDPGVTILDQVTYALTELGYVNSFGIEDVLTQPDGSIRYQEQFFNAETILTSAPVSIDDYRRLVFDRIQCVDNLYIQPQTITIANQPVLTGFYQVSIYSRQLLNTHSHTTAATNTEVEAINAKTLAKRKASLATDVQQLLNSERNVGEFFLLPTVLKAHPIQLTGEAVLSAEADINQVYQDIDHALANYVSPLVEQMGYNQAQQYGASTDDIFNGPELENGWIINPDGFGTKRSCITLVDIITTLSAVEGVVALGNIAFTSGSLNGDDGDDNTIKIADTDVASIALSSGFSLIKSQTKHTKTAWQQTVSDLNQLKAQLSASSIDAKVDIAPALPQGRFRHIENYYSIQYTFPDIYGVGPNSLQSDTPDYRVAQARQLKGYLLLFDQVIANQLSQLANLNNLFSFSFSRIPSSETEYHASLNLQAEQQRGPVTPSIPMQPFARSYFCQPLYDVPDVQALLAGQNSYQYFYPDDPKDSTQRVQLVWKRFKADPFNQYFYGLNHAQENVEEAEQRRDQMLGHLLARHGESTDIYNDMIDAMQWYGGVCKTRIMVKTLWMQNLQGLSYRRNQAIDFSACAPLKPLGRFYLSENDYQQLLIERGTNLWPFLQAIRGKGFSSYNDVVRSLASNLVAQLKQHIAASGKTIKVNTAKVLQRSQAVTKTLPLQDTNQQLLAKQNTHAAQPANNGLMFDGTYNAKALDAAAKLSADDWRSHATFVLKVNLLLGLTQHYSACSLALVRLLAADGFKTWLNANVDLNSQNNFPDIITANASTLDELHDTNVQFIDVKQADDSEVRYVSVSVQKTEVMRLPAADLTSSQVQAYADQLLWLARNQGGMLIEHTLLQPSITNDNTDHTAGEASGQDSNESAPDTWYYLQASMVFPDYILRTQQAQFAYFLGELQQLHWPSHVQLHFTQGDYRALHSTLTAYQAWYKRMRYFSGNHRQLHSTLGTRLNGAHAVKSTSGINGANAINGVNSDSAIPSSEAVDADVSTQALHKAQLSLKNAVSALTTLTPLQAPAQWQSSTPSTSDASQTAANQPAQNVTEQANNTAPQQTNADEEDTHGDQ